MKGSRTHAPRLPRAARWLAAATLLLLGACCCGPSQGATESAGVREAVERLVAADNRRDLAAVLAGYTEDVVWLPPGEEPLRGKAALRSRYERLFADFGVAMEIEVVEARCEGLNGWAWGRVRGTLTPVAEGETVRVDDSFLALARREGGTWRVSQLMWGPRAHD
jgi:uncharacterized protein (TIGR02246 family)